MRRPLFVGLGLTLLACSFQKPWDVKDAPKSPPDLQYRTGVEVGHDVYVWRCYEGKRVVVSQGGSAFCGASAPRLSTSACGPGPEDEVAERAHDVPESLRWPGSPPPAPRIAHESESVSESDAATSPPASSSATSPAP
ncbi:MAG: hypothetical protein KIT84_42505 [Labilithrix sp.]|nr:hypothetical protein [Labilithrix sp.]MCW5817749.1 hypothetical protein [Labilithrix sp.]